MTQLDSFRPLEVLQESERFLVQKGMYGGKLAVLKTAKMPEMIPNLVREIQAYDMYAQLAAGGDAPYMTAAIIDAGIDWLLLEYLEGQPMSEVIDAQNQSEMYEHLATIMAFCDGRIAISLDGKTMPASAAQIRTRVKRVNELRQTFNSLDNYGVGALRDGLDRAADFYIAHCDQLESAFVNPDLTPSHVMMGGQKLAIFDFENARLDGERFSDVINLAMKIWFIEGERDIALKFLQSFWQKTNYSQADYSIQIKTLVYRRCVGFTNELLTDPDQYHNTSLTMNEKFAQNITSVLDWADSMNMTA